MEMNIALLNGFQLSTIQKGGLRSSKSGIQQRERPINGRTNSRIATESAEGRG